MENSVNQVFTQGDAHLGGEPPPLTQEGHPVVCLCDPCLLGDGGLRDSVIGGCCGWAGAIKEEEVKEQRLETQRDVGWPGQIRISNTGRSERFVLSSESSLQLHGSE